MNVTKSVVALKEESLMYPGHLIRIALLGGSLLHSCDNNKKSDL